MTTLVFHPSADRELMEAARFYESRAVGLGGDFIREVERILAQITINPEAGRVFVGSVRRRLVRRFPFAILYESGPENVFIVAMMHLHRRPSYWKRRLQDRYRTSS